MLAAAYSAIVSVPSPAPLEFIDSALEALVSSCSSMALLKLKLSQGTTLFYGLNVSFPEVYKNQWFV